MSHSRPREVYNGPEIGFSPDGKTLAAANGSGAGALCVWDTTTGKERLKRDLPTQDGTTGVALTANGKKLAIYSYQSKFDVKTGARWVEQRARLWDIEKGTEATSFQPPEGGTRAIAFSQDGKMLAVAQGDGLHVCDPETGRKVRTLSDEKASYYRIAFSPDGTLATNGKDPATIQLWDAAAGRPKRLLRGHDKDVSCLAFSADGKRLVSSSIWDSTFRVWDVASGDTVLVHRGSAAVGGGCVALSPDGKTVAEGSVNSVFALLLWDVATGKEAAGPSGHIAPVTLTAFTGDGKAVTGLDNTIRVWDPTDGKQLSVVREPNSIRLAALSPDGKTIAIGRQDYTVCLHDLGTGKEIFQLDGQAGYTGVLTFAPDGKTLAAGYSKNTPKGNVCKMILWDVAAGKKTLEIPTPGFNIECIAFSPDGKTLLSTSNGLRIWDRANGAELGQILTKGFGISGHNVLRFSPDGALLAAPSYPKGFGVWNAATRDSLGRYDSDGVTVRSVAFSTDNRLLACGKEDGSVELWDLKKWKPVAKGQGPRGRVYALAFSKDDRRLISGHEDTTALVWDVPKLLAAAPK
jgi:WD40 repeat protein